MSLTICRGEHEDGLATKVAKYTMGVPLKYAFRVSLCSRYSDLRGFTLLELVVIIAAIAILAAAVTPAVVQQIADTRVQSTRDETRVLYEAMVGPSTAETQFGFVGDIGRLPNSFQELVEASGLPSYNTNHVRNVGMGWRGPYVNTGSSASDYLTDAFGRAYTGASSGQVRSPGQDGIANNADDIVYPPTAAVVTGDVAITVKMIQGGKTIVDPAGYRVDLYYASGGSEASVSDSGGPFTFSNVPMGIHAVHVVKTNNPGAGNIVAQDTIIVRPASTAAAELWF